MMRLRTFGDNAVALTALLALAGTILVADRRVQAVEREIEDGKSVDAGQDQQLAQMTKAIGELLELSQESNALVTSVYRRGLVIRGQAEIMDTGDDPYIELNTWEVNGPRRLMAFDMIKVTNLSHPDQPYHIIRVEGGFTNRTPNFVIKCSKAAAELLHANNGWTEVLLEPVWEDK